MADASRKSDHAFRTIGELAAELDVPQHILRYWETRFPQLKPLQRAGNRRYYRPADVELARRIHQLLNRDGYTIRGVQQLLESRGPAAPAAAPAAAANETGPEGRPAFAFEQLRALRRTLVEALEESAL
jgi:DNA-binding transcriptional MerR regulator